MTAVYLAALIALFAFAFALLAWAAPRRYQIKVTRALPAPPERVWTYLAEPTRFPQWFPHVESCVLDGGPPEGVGQKRRLQLRFDHARGSRDEHASTWDPHKLLVLEHGPELHDGRPVIWTDAKSEFRLSPAEGGSQLTGVLWFSGRGAMGRIFSLLSIRRRHEKTMRVALANLERRLREDAPAG